mmetsp:Transcript_54914/g.139196  ORF Transcript_54914/g.139196 Transcript_54914/m.139196 type:complete len:490 (-) Transcript_54914:292-1761(-)
MAALAVECRLLARDPVFDEERDAGDDGLAASAQVASLPERSHRRLSAVAGVATFSLLLALVVAVTSESSGGDHGRAHMSSAVELATVEHSEAPTEATIAQALQQAAAEESEDKDCGIAELGDSCYFHVVWAMTKGIRRNPDWYPGLTPKSKFEDFQKHLAAFDSNSTCKMPCVIEGCWTATPGCECWNNVHWAMTTGIVEHPTWFPGLTKASPMENFQSHVHKQNSTVCPNLACNPQPFSTISLYCWAVVRSDGYEVDLVKAQVKKKAGMFACDAYVVVSDKDLGLAVDGVQTLTISTTKVTGYTAAGTSPNAPVFVEAMSKLREDGRYRQHDWVIKSDPDTVLLPDRLRMVLEPTQQPRNPYPPPYAPAPGAGLFVPNCDKQATWGTGWGANGLWPMMYGSIEMVSREALDNYFVKEESCKSSIQGWQKMGEDRYLGLCYRHLQAGELFLKQGDATCGGGSCGDGRFQAYHPFKSVDTWMQCWDQAMR